MKAPDICPHGVTVDDGKLKGLGDLVSLIATPIAKSLSLPCIDKDTGKLKPKSKCAERREKLNKAVPFNLP